MRQHTLVSTYTFKGKGLHGGGMAEMTLLPAPEGSGIVFQRTDMGGALVEALYGNVVRSDRSTVLAKDGVEVGTTEHLLAALSALGVDNALIKVNSPELPVLDGSALPYVRAILADGLAEQNASREYFVVTRHFEWTDEKSGSKIEVDPAGGPAYAVTTDFGSKVLGVQKASWDAGVDFATEIAPCRTFCFLHEIKPLLSMGLIKGGDLENALVIDEPNGYYNNAALRFENECARHKLLDLIGDFALLGKPLAGRVTAYKPGHRVNAGAVRALANSSIR